MQDGYGDNMECLDTNANGYQCPCVAYNNFGKCMSCVDLTTLYQNQGYLTAAEWAVQDYVGFKSQPGGTQLEFSYTNNLAEKVYFSWFEFSAERPDAVELNPGETSVAMPYWMDNYGTPPATGHSYFITTNGYSGPQVGALHVTDYWATDIGRLDIVIDQNLVEYYDLPTCQCAAGACGGSSCVQHTTGTHTCNPSADDYNCLQWTDGPAAPWLSVRLHNGDVECSALATDAECQYFTSEADCNAGIASQIPNILTGVTCGAQYQTEFGHTGYDSSWHWCMLINRP